MDKVVSRLEGVVVCGFVSEEYYEVDLAAQVVIVGERSIHEDE